MKRRFPVLAVVLACPLASGVPAAGDSVLLTNTFPVHKSS